MDYSLQKLAKLYVSEIVRLHGVHVSIICYGDPRVTSPFWKKLHEVLGLRLDFSTTFHPQTDGQTEKVIQILEDSLRNCVIDFQGECQVLGPGLVFETKGKVSLWKKVLRFGRKGKLSPRFIGPYQILKHVGPVAYQLEIPLELDRIHDVFHVSMLKRYRSNPSHIISFKEIEIRLDLAFKEELVQILDCDIKVLRRNFIPLVKVLWRTHGTEIATWEPKDSMRQQYPHLLTKPYSPPSFDTLLFPIPKILVQAPTVTKRTDIQRHHPKGVQRPAGVKVHVDLARRAWGWCVQGRNGAWIVPETLGVSGILM
ncbi:uncharacterized protein LOC128041710 [Gossypium raimondii]|uniref:uncharacterized protein LOC128041710 n=1 Tax=Gossypium raimondii TaxID=29730 RepID=UPI00227B6970|nr:uncharacterized protein LOC128041710 [Gossypium raimondii]